jgi:hypothetical protein
MTKLLSSTQLQKMNRTHFWRLGDSGIFEKLKVVVTHILLMHGPVVWMVWELNQYRCSKNKMIKYN